jgi:hypothetical protein
MNSIENNTNLAAYTAAAAAAAATNNRWNQEHYNTAAVYYNTAESYYRNQLHLNYSQTSKWHRNRFGSFDLASLTKFALISNQVHHN